jgi:1,5-anhydro-D-fructose reductase (1,5-anhydro-D-mannitol-forming)
MVRVAMLSRWHVHADEYASLVNDEEQAQVAAVWDEEPERGRSWAGELGVDFEADLDHLLARDDVDAVAVCAPTNMHPEVMIKAAQAGKHIFTEKVMATTVEECREIADAVTRVGVKFCISFPRRGLPEVQLAKKLVAAGHLGQITLLRIRVGHSGSTAGWLPPHFYDPVTCGGGAMIDLGAHGMYIACWLLGEPRRINSTFNHITGREVEDNTLSVITFDNQAIAINETSFVQYGGVFYLEINGTEGTYITGGPDAKTRIQAPKWSGSDDWVEPETLPAPLLHPVTQWINGITQSCPIDYGLTEGIQLTELMEGAYRAHREGCTVSYPLG